MISGTASLMRSFLQNNPFESHSSTQLSKHIFVLFLNLACEFLLDFYFEKAIFWWEPIFWIIRWFTVSVAPLAMYKVPLLPIGGAFISLNLNIDTGLTRNRHGWSKSKVMTVVDVPIYL